jgi:hypothetical protein
MLVTAPCWCFIFTSPSGICSALDEIPQPALPIVAKIKRNKSHSRVCIIRSTCNKSRVSNISRNATSTFVLAASRVGWIRWVCMAEAQNVKRKMCWRYGRSHESILIALSRLGGTTSSCKVANRDKISSANPPPFRDRTSQHREAQIFPI